MPRRKHHIFSVEVVSGDNVLPEPANQLHYRFGQKSNGRRPLKYRKQGLGKVRPVQVCFPVKVLEQIDTLREACGQNPSEYLTKLLIEHMKATESSSEPSAVS